jgi:hypothetical protein
VRVKGNHDRDGTYEGISQATAGIREFTDTIVEAYDCGFYILDVGFDCGDVMRNGKSRDYNRGEEDERCG